MINIECVKYYYYYRCVIYCKIRFKPPLFDDSFSSGTLTESTDFSQ